MISQPLNKPHTLAHDGVCHTSFNLQDFHESLSPLLPAARRDWHKRRARLELFGCLSRNVTSASRCVSCVAMSFSDSRNPHFGPFASPSRAALRRASSRRPACQCSKKPENSFFALSRLEQRLCRRYLATCELPSAMLRKGLACVSCVVNAPQFRLAVSRSFGGELALRGCALIGG